VIHALTCGTHDAQPNYALVDDAIVWEAVTTELPALRQRLNELLAEN